MKPYLLFATLALLATLNFSQAAKIKLIKVKSEVYKGESIHIQCLVEYSPSESENELTVEFYRSTNQPGGHIQHLSSNGKLRAEVPLGQNYDAYVEDLGSNTKEHAFRITNIHQRDSGNYSCWVRNNHDLIDLKRKSVQVVEEEDYHEVQFMSSSDYSQPVSYEFDTFTDTVETGLKCEEKRMRKDIENLTIPVVCYPQDVKPIVFQKPNETVKLPCIAESHPPAKVSWFREIVKPNGDIVEKQLHSRGKISMEIGDFGNTYQTVLLNIHQVTEEDYGTYICLATNEHNQQDRLQIELSKPVDSATAKVGCSISFFTFTLVSALLLQ